MRLTGGPPLHLDKGDEPDFRTVSRCRIDIRDESQSDDLWNAEDGTKRQELVDLLLPVVNRALLAIRNFGRVTTAKEYKPEQKPETLLRTWGAFARIRGKWREVAPAPEKQPFDYLGLGALEENIERGSLSVTRWPDIEQGLVEDIKPNPEDEFLTNSLQHLDDGNPRLALIEATVCLEIVLSQVSKSLLESETELSEGENSQGAERRGPYDAGRFDPRLNIYSY